MLKNMCKSLLDKNYELYLTHQRTIEEEQKERQALSLVFSERMKEVNVELEAHKEKRQKEID
jgi:hypothetical protein